MPAPDPKLQLFQAEQQKDLLVVYNEYSERTKTVTGRAYLLHKNQNRVEQGQPPYFISTRMSRDLPVVPVFQELATLDASSLPVLYAIVSTNTESFMIYSNHQSISFHDLPFYADPAGKAERSALFPIAITVDVALAAGVIYIYFWNIAPNNNYWPSH